MTVERRARCRECGGPRHPRSFALPERRETPLDAVKAFLTLILVVVAFAFGTFYMASLQVTP